MSNVLREFEKTIENIEREGRKYHGNFRENIRNNCADFRDSGNNDSCLEVAGAVERIEGRERTESNRKEKS